MVTFNPRQQAAVAFPCNTVVNASAGTGKTATLVGAYLSRLAQQIPPGQILAITFTEKAAAEMRDRLKREVLARASVPPRDGAPEVDWRRVLTGLSNAPISTIHAFCAWLLKENPLEAGVDPHFTVWDEDDGGAVRREVTLTLIREQICAGHPGAQALFRDLQLVQSSRYAPRHLTETVEAALRWLNGLGVDLQRRDPQGRNWLEDRFAAQQARLSELQGRFERGRDEVRQAFRALATVERAQGKNAQKLLQRVKGELASIEAALERLTIEAPADEAAVCDTLAETLKAGNLGNHPTDMPIRACLETLRGWLGDHAVDGGLKALFAAAKSVDLTRHLIALVGEVQAEYGRRKTLARSLDFDDLLTYARNLLKFHPTVRRRYKERFSAILVDEFQDTDELQGEIVCLLAEERGRERAFHPFERYRPLLEQIALDPHRLFIVGDPKQSIYRFRRADVGVFVAMTEKIVGTGGNGLALVENYRTSAGLLTFANTLFSTVMDGAGAHPLPPHTDTRHRIRYEAQDHLQPGGESPRQGRLLLVLGAEGDAADAGRALEARAFAALIDEWYADGALTSYRDAAILVKTHSFGQLYEGALRERGIPYYRVKGGRFFHRQEVVDLAALLSFLVDPADDLALAEVLTSPLAGLDFADLYRLCEGQEAGSPLSGWLAPDRLATLPAPVRERLARFAGLANRLLQLRDRLEPAELLEWAIGDTGYDAVLMAQAEGEQQVANVAKLLELARGFSRKGLSKLDDFVAYLRQRLGDDAARAPDAQIMSEEDDVVRIMTIHQAKGLEFPVVFIPDLSREGRGERGSRVVFDEHWGVMCAAAYGINRARLPHPLMLEAELVERDKEVEEQKRLLYVALTRPKHTLVLGEGAGRRPGPWHQWVMRALTAEPDGAERLEQVRSGALPSAALRLGDVAVELRSAAALAQRPVSAALLTPPLTTLTSGELVEIQRRVWEWQPLPTQAVELSPTALATLAKCARYFFLHDIAGLAEQPPGQDGGLPAVDKGRIVHGVLERVELDLPPEAIAARVRELIQREPGAFLLTPTDTADLEHDLERYLQSPTWQALRADPTLRREVPFQLHIPGPRLELFIRGRMDVVLVRDGMPVVIDHKYARFDRHKEAGYEVPMTIYALAAMRTLGSPRAEVQLSFLRSRVYPTEAQIISAAHQIEERLLRLAQVYVDRRHTGDVEDWPRIAREQCEQARCGFRPFCWGRQEGDVRAGP
ncbi:MAG TPA: UvrD-helicase domain-containing protein [Candidatus Tectomicrobia bacterium]|nr:UvrD-helicase domain-containing protein [Candidatus Tectomicrobia bacterium]